MIENALIIGILGILFGSFGSVLLGRLENKHDRKTIKSILIGRSQCPQCNHTLGRDELIPLRSYLKQKGKCKHCHTPISKEYPILEIVCGLVFTGTYILSSQLGIVDIGEIIFWIITNRFLTLLIVHDFKTYELHDAIRFLNIVRIFGGIIIGKISDISISMTTTVLGVGLFAGIYFFGKRYVKKKFKSNEEGFGQGDIFIGALLGTLLPSVAKYNHIVPTTINFIQLFLALIILASLIGIIYASIRNVFGKKRKQTGKSLFTQRQSTNKIIPFIPALILAFWILLYKANILNTILF